MMIVDNKQIGFIYKNNKSIDKIFKEGEVVFEKGFLRELTSTTLPITFGGVGKDLKDYRVYGNTYQNSTTGKNLVNMSSIETGTKGGITCTYDVTTQILTFNGTCTTNNTRFNTSGLSIPFTKNITTISANYISGSISNNGLFRTYVSGFSNYEGVDLTQLNSENKIVSKTSSFNVTKSIIDFRFNTGAVLTNFQVKVMIADTTDTSYEPYTGGQPSPNPDYPQEIISCGDRTRNLFDVSKVYVRTNDRGIDVSVEKGKVKLVGTNTTSSAIGVALNDVNNYYSLKAGKTYVAKYITGQSASATTYRMDIRKYNNTSNILAYESGTNGLTYTPTTDIDVRFVVRVPANGTVDLNGHIMFEESNILHDYEPYGYKIPITTKGNNIISQTAYQTGKNLRADGTISDNSNYYIVKQTNLKPLSKYMLSENQNYVVTGSGTSIRINAYDENDNFISNLVDGNRTEVKRYTHTFTVPLNTSYVLIGFRNTDTNIELVESIDTNIYLDEPLRKIDEYSDYLDFKNGKVVRNIHEVILKGTNAENWVFPQTLTETYRFLSQNGLPNGKNGSFIKIITNKFINGTSTGDNGDYEHIRSASRGYPDYIGLNIFKTRLTEGTLEAFKTWLSNNPITVDYILENPVEEDIELPNIETLVGNNTFNIETELTPSQVYIKYKSNV